MTGADALIITPATSQADTGGAALATLTERIVALYKEHAGRGPTKARAFMSDDVLVCLLEGGYLKAEQTLINNGRTDVIELERQAFHSVMRPAFCEVAESVCGREVTGFSAACDHEAEMTTLVFRLSPHQA